MRAQAAPAEYMSGMAGLRYWHWQFALIFLGVGLRLSHYLSNRSLWHDEALLALNLTRRSLSNLLSPLDYNQAAPIGFLMIEKWAIELLGDGEFSLRLPPLAAGIVSLFLFRAVAQCLLKPASVVVALGLFALCQPLIYYSAEVKQYSFDVACALGALLIGFRLLEDRQLTFTEIGLFSAIGSILVWLSHPSVFCLSSVGLTALVVAWLRRERLGDLARLSVPLALWGCSFLVSYFVSLSRITQNPELIEFWRQRQAFLPLPPLSMSEVKVLVKSFSSLLGQPVGTDSSSLAGFAFLLGVYGAFRISKGWLCCLLVPGFVAILASALGKYPFTGKFTLFLVPMSITLIAAGSEAVFEARRSLPLAGVVLVSILFSGPLLSQGSLGSFFVPLTREEIKPIMAYLAVNKRAEDGVYVYRRAFAAFDYYRGRYGLQDTEVMIGASPADTSSYKADLRKLSEKGRVWLVFSHVKGATSGLNHESLLLRDLEGLGSQLGSYKKRGASLYLYSFKDRNLNTRTSKYELESSDRELPRPPG